MERLDIKAPGDMEIILGCSGSDRFVGFSCQAKFETLFIHHADRDDIGNFSAWDSFLKRPYVAEALRKFRVNGQPLVPAGQSMILDRTSRKLWLCSEEGVSAEIGRLQRMFGMGAVLLEHLDVPILEDSQVREIIEAARLPGHRKIACVSIEEKVSKLK